MTSRSFAAVIKELEGELCRVICLFYLVLRGLDTIEDDMTLDPERKCKLLEEFYLKLSEPGWTFTDSEYRSVIVLPRRPSHSLTMIVTFVNYLQADQMKKIDNS